MTSSIASVQSFEDISAGLSPSEQQSLQSGKPVVHVVGDRYAGKILTTAPVDAVWSVLTDYENFSSFLPAVESSQVVEAEGDRKVVEQIASLNMVLASMESRVLTENVEAAQKQIDFRLLDGDLEKMRGHWRVCPIVMARESASDASDTVSNIDPGDTHHTLICQTAEAEAGAGLLEGVFARVFTNSMKNNLTAIAQEACDRSKNGVSPNP